MDTTIETLEHLSPAAIDREVARVEADLTATNDPDVAVALARRRQALVDQRAIAVVRDRASQRQQQVERIEADRVAFREVTERLGAQLHQHAVAIDQWVSAGGALVTAYNATLRELGTVDDWLEPPTRGRELQFLMLRERLAIDERLREALMLNGALDGTVSAFSRDAAGHTVTSYVTRRWALFLRHALERLPAVPDEAGDRTAPALEGGV